MNCSKILMARKMNSLKLAPEVHGGVTSANRRVELPITALYLMRSRPAALKVSPPRRRLQVADDAESLADVPQPVKIIHAG